MEYDYNKIQKQWAEILVKHKNKCDKDIQQVTYKIIEIQKKQNKSYIDEVDKVFFDYFKLVKNILDTLIKMNYKIVNYQMLMFIGTFIKNYINIHLETYFIKQSQGIIELKDKNLINEEIKEKYIDLFDCDIYNIFNYIQKNLICEYCEISDINIKNCNFEYLYNNFDGAWIDKTMDEFKKEISI